MPKIALIQQSAGPDRIENRERGLENARQAISQGAQVIAFAEVAFDQFFPQCPAPDNQLPLDLAETIPGPTTEPFQELAREHGVVIILNLYERSGSAAYDSSPVIDADGQILGVTRMVHIAEMPGFHEQSYYVPGDRGMPVYATEFGRIGVAICYDRHYPEVMRALGLQHADLVIVPQAGSLGEWPDGLYEAELRVASFQNGYFTALANRVGPEGSLVFGGESFICDPEGQLIAQSPSKGDHILYADIDYEKVAQSTARRLFLRDLRPGVSDRLGTTD